MTRRDFEVIARAVKDAHDPWADTNNTRPIFAAAMADALAATNSGFNRERFLQACGVLPPKGKG